MKSFIIGYSDGDRSRDSVIGIAICYGLDGLGSNPGRSTSVFFTTIHTGFRAHPASCTVATGVLSREVKRLGREVDRSLASSAEIMNNWSCTSIPSLYLRGVGRDLTFLPLQIDLKS
jgi:hypothetical protein